jgi:hypothetical protein
LHFAVGESVLKAIGKVLAGFGLELPFADRESGI